MKKLILLLGITLSLTIVQFNKSQNDHFQNQATLAIIVDGVEQTTFPTSGDYLVTVDCENAVGKWLYDEQKLVYESITGKVICNVAFTTSTRTNLNTYITNLVTTNPTQGDGKVVNENGIRYQGKNPNNYIWFNNELWQIIGVFDSNHHGITGENLVKIIRNETLAGVGWNSADTNDWNNSSLKKLLNGAYYDWDANGSSASTYCYGYSTTISATCDYSDNGISDEYRNMIKNVTWYLGGYPTNATTASTFYNYERSGTYVYSGRDKTGTGYIGLMYASDYGYSVLASDCARTTQLSAYNTANCAGKSWLYGSSYEWTLTQNSYESNSIYLLNNLGGVHSSSSNDGCGSRPVLYLDSSVYIKNIGSENLGSISNPYIIGM